MPKGEMSFGQSMGEGFVGNPKRQNSTQPGGGRGGGRQDFAGSFGKGGGSGQNVAGVQYEGAAGPTQTNGGNYAEVGSSARVFGNGGAMKG